MLFDNVWWCLSDVCVWTPCGGACKSYVCAIFGACLNRCVRVCVCVLVYVCAIVCVCVWQEQPWRQQQQTIFVGRVAHAKHLSQHLVCVCS